MTEHAYPTPHDQTAMPQAEYQQGALGQFIPEPWADQLKAAMEPGPLTRYLLRHQHQEFTDTTAAYEAGEDVVPGDCWRACLASLLEVPLAEVPHFIHLYPMDDRNYDNGPMWWQASVAWVEQQRPGWTLAAWERPEPWTPFWNTSWSDTAPPSEMIEAAGGSARLILNAPSPRGAWNHSVLVDAQTGELEHDPFPGGGGVLAGSGDRVALVRPEWLEQ